MTETTHGELDPLPLIPKPIDSGAQKDLQTTLKSIPVSPMQAMAKQIDVFLQCKFIDACKIIRNFPIRAPFHNVSEYCPVVLKFVVVGYKSDVSSSVDRSLDCFLNSVAAVAQGKRVDAKAFQGLPPSLNIVSVLVTNCTFNIK